MDSSTKADLKLGKRVFLISKEVGEASTAHAIPNICRSPYVSVKIMWTIFLLGCTALCIVVINNTVQNYLQFDVVTKIRKYNQFPSVFPTVSFCNKNRFTTDYAIEFLKNISTQYELNLFNKTAYDAMTSEEIDANTDLLYEYANFELLTLDKEIKKKLGYQIEDYSIICKYANKSCNMSDFYWFEHPTYGNCYSYNVGIDKFGNKTDLKTTMGSMPAQGLYVELFVGIPDELQFLSSGSGLVVYVHNNTQSPLGLNPDNVNLQTLTQMSVSRLFSKKLRSPFSECQYDSDSPPDSNTELVKLILASGFAYTQEDCITQCYQKFQIARCSCRNAGLPSLYNATSCITYNQSICQNQFANDFQNVTYVNENCMPLCPLECSSIEYSTTRSFFEYPISTGAYDDYNAIAKLYQGRNFSGRPVETNIIALNVYLRSLSYLQMEEIAAMDFITLLSNLGGIAGLFLGVSVLSFVEFIEIGQRLVIDLYDARKKNKKITSIKK